MAAQLRRAVIGDEPILRALRLQALAEAPEAFGSTYERELARTTLDWQRWMAPGVTFILSAPGGAGGLVAGQHDAADPAVVHLMALWVHPELRGSGAADELVAAVLAWARVEGASTVRLEVMQANGRARRLYERAGFRVTGRAPERDHGDRVEVSMECLVSAAG